MMELHAYRHQLEAKHKLGTATEHTHRSALESLFESMFQNVLAINDPKKTRYGAVDFTIMRGENEIGRVETKKIGENLDGIERGMKKLSTKQYLPLSRPLAYPKVSLVTHYARVDL